MADTSFIYPATGTQYLRFTRAGVGQPATHYEAHYGFGNAILDSLATGYVGKKIRADYAFEICGDGDTTVVNVP